MSTAIKGGPMIIDRIIRFSHSISYFDLSFRIFAGSRPGLYSATKLPIDAVPDVTTNQVQINTLAPAFAPLEMEKYVTFPIEVAMSNLPEKGRNPFNFSIRAFSSNDYVSRENGYLLGTANGIGTAFGSERRIT